jgi:hypothetical protein
MLLPSASARRVIALTLGVTAAGGIGFGAYSLGSSAGANSSYLPNVAASDANLVTGEPGTTAAVSPEASAASPLTLEEATAVAAQVAPGRLVQWDEDQEPTGLRYDITLLHDDGSTTDVEVDTVTGQVTSVDHDNDGD